jgi:hypothetical protein
MRKRKPDRQDEGHIVCPFPQLDATSVVPEQVVRDRMGSGLNSRFRLSRIEGFLAADWPVVPGAWWDEHEMVYRCGRVGCCDRMRGLHPVGGALRPVSDVGPWIRSPATILLVTGLGIDVVEVDLRTVGLDAAMLARLSSAGPVALLDVVLPRLLIPVAAPVFSDLAVNAAATGGFARRTGVAGVGLHGAGSWVALPPARLRGGTTRWVTSPRSVGWALPDLAFVLDTLMPGSSASASVTTPVTPVTPPAPAGPSVSWRRR